MLDPGRVLFRGAGHDNDLGVEVVWFLSTRRGGFGKRRCR